MRRMSVVGVALNSYLICEGGVDASEVGFSVADAEGEIVDVGYTRAGVGVSTLR